MNVAHLPMIISEDNSKAQPRVDVALRGQSVILHGCNGGEVCVAKAAEIIEAVSERGMATSLYAVAIAPMGRHGLHFPLMAIPNDGTNDTLGSDKVRALRGLRWRGRRSTLQGSKCCTGLRDGWGLQDEVSPGTGLHLA